MNSKQSPLIQYLTRQSKYKDSPYKKFFETFTLSFVLKSLDKDKKEKFLALLDKESFDKIPAFLAQNITNFATKLEKAFGKEIEKINTKIKNGNNKETTNE